MKRLILSLIALFGFTVIFGMEEQQNKPLNPNLENCSKPDLKKCNKPEQQKLGKYYEIKNNFHSSNNLISFFTLFSLSKSSCNRTGS